MIQVKINGVDFSGVFTSVELKEAAKRWSPPFAWTAEQIARIEPGARIVSWRFDIACEHRVISFDPFEGRIELDGTGGSAPLAYCDPGTLIGAKAKDNARRWKLRRIARPSRKTKHLNRWARDW